MTTTFALQRIAADLHAAGRGPEGWPQASLVMRDLLRCPNVFGDSIPDGSALSSTLLHVAERTASVRACVEARSGECVRVGDGQRYLADHELLPRIEMAIGAAQPAAIVDDPRLSVFEALPFPVFICDSQRRLLHANAAGQGELDRKTWLRTVGDRLIGANSPLETRLAAALRTNVEGDCYLTLLQPGHDEAELMFRQVTSSRGGAYWVLHLFHFGRHSDDSLAELVANLGLTPRQAELAGLLIDGCSLTEAAHHLGIVRGSANDLLKRLFTVTGTRRQADLVGYLNRRLANRFNRAGPGQHLQVSVLAGLAVGSAPRASGARRTL